MSEMALADNIVKYRKKNQLSQEQLAESLNISRQSISRWETGETLPGIDNLISLSGLLDISLDELITGEPYLHFPFDYGKPKNRWPVFFLVLLIIAFGGIVAIENIFFSLLLCIMAYFMGTFMSPFDFKRYYTYWTLNRTGITYINDAKKKYTGVDELIIPIKALLHLRKPQFISYRRIKRIEIKVDLFAYNPNSMITIDDYVPNMGQTMHEMFYLEVTTIDNQKIYLDLRQYYWPDSKERKMLATILTFLRRKNIEFIDKQNITEIVKDKNIKLTKELYRLRDE